MKRYLLLLFIFLLTTVIANAQEAVVPDTVLQFNKRYINCENHWVAIPPLTSAEKYAYGFIYIDPMAGFTFNFEGFFTIQPNGKFVKDITKNKKSFFKYSFKEDTRPLALITQDHFEELDIYSKPDWLKIYTEYIDTVAHNIAWGKYYNREKASDHALPILEQVYKTNPHADGLEFELAFAYNSLKRPDDAIKVLVDAIKNDPDDMMLHEQLGISFLNKGEFEKGVNKVKEALAMCTDEQVTEKTEMALQLALAYKNAKNTAIYIEWINKAQTWAPKNSPIYQQVAMIAQQH